MHMKSPRTAGRRPVPGHQRGDTMIEVLVTIIIIAVGVLGAAALQITTLKNLSSSHSTSIAAIVAEDFGERMRANPVAALAGDYVHKTAPTNAITNCATKKCTTAQLADFDMDSWWDQLTAVLPSGQGEVKLIGGTTYELTVRWDDDRSGSNKGTCPPKSDTDLECFRLNITI